MLEDAGLLVEKIGEAAGADNGHGLTVLGLDARDEALDHPDIAPIETGLHGGDGGFADHVLGADHRDARQHGGGAVQRLGRNVGAGRDDAAFVIAIGGDDVEGRGTTVAMIAASISAKPRPCSCSSCCSSTAYSSAVLVVSVTLRHSARVSVPSWTAKTILVLPASIQRSMAIPYNLPSMGRL